MFDVVVIGAGIMGAAVSRELSRYELKTLLLDKENDVSCGTTKSKFCNSPMQDTTQKKEALWQNTMY